MLPRMLGSKFKKIAKKSFKASQKGTLFDILKTVDSYIEVETIVDQMKN